MASRARPGLSACGSPSGSKSPIAATFRPGPDTFGVDEGRGATEVVVVGADVGPGSASGSFSLPAWNATYIAAATARAITTTRKTRSFRRRRGGGATAAAGAGAGAGAGGCAGGAAGGGAAAAVG